MFFADFDFYAFDQEDAEALGVFFCFEWEDDVFVAGERKDAEVLFVGVVY